MKAKNDSKTPKTPTTPKAKAAKDASEEPDRLPGSLAELKETKGGFVAHRFLSGKDRDAIAKELGAAFKLPNAQALKITRRITARVRLYRRIFELVSVKK